LIIQRFRKYLRDEGGIPYKHSDELIAEMEETLVKSGYQLESKFEDFSPFHIVLIFTAQTEKMN